jgi:hypothetical protein
MKEVWCVVVDGVVKHVCASAYRARVEVQEVLTTIQDRMVPWDLVAHGAEWKSNNVRVEITRMDVLE